jgi:hypothetical protein
MNSNAKLLSMVSLGWLIAMLLCAACMLFAAAISVRDGYTSTALWYGFGAICLAGTSSIIHVFIETFVTIAHNVAPDANSGYDEDLERLKAAGRRR